LTRLVVTDHQSNGTSNHFIKQSKSVANLIESVQQVIQKHREAYRTTSPSDRKASRSASNHFIK